MVSFSLTLVMKLFKTIPAILQAVIYIVTFIIFKVCFNFRVKGLENIENLPPRIIFAANHLSEWDGILIRVALPFFSKKFSPMYYVSRTKDFYINSGWRKLLYGGALFRLLGAYPVYKGKKDYEYSLQHFIKILNMKGCVCIFPEGVRSASGAIGEAHGGVAFLAHKTNTPIVPTVVKGVHKLTFIDFLFRRRLVEVDFGKPIALSSLTKVTVDNVKTEAESIMWEVSKMNQ